MPIPQLTPFPDPPRIYQPEEEFDAKADEMAGHLPILVNEINAMADAVNTELANIDDATTAAVNAANAANTSKDAAAQSATNAATSATTATTKATAAATSETNALASKDAAAQSAATAAANIAQVGFIDKSIGFTTRCIQAMIAVAELHADLVGRTTILDSSSTVLHVKLKKLDTKITTLNRMFYLEFLIYAFGASAGNKNGRFAASGHCWPALNNAEITNSYGTFVASIYTSSDGFVTIRVDLKSTFFTTIVIDQTQVGLGNNSTNYFTASDFEFVVSNATTI